jgi:hypothetical protein
MIRTGVVLAVSAVAGTASADEHAASLGVGWATFSVPGKKMGTMQPPAITPDVGGMLSGTYEYALSTDISLRGEFAFNAFYGGEQKGQSTGSFAGLFDAGVTFRFDVLKCVPYAFAGLGGVVADGGPIGGDTDLVLVVGGGLDSLLSRDRSWGVEVRLASFGGDITLFTAGVRGTYRWGFF